MLTQITVEEKNIQTLMDDGICPDCYSTKTEENYENNRVVFNCKECGLTASS